MIDKEFGRNIENVVVLVILGFIGIGCFFVLRPFISALLWSAILAFSTWPIYMRLVRSAEGQKIARSGHHDSGPCRRFHPACRGPGNHACG
ncbi:MAG: hypothetical protein MZV70_59030 [Desulfobacterales bacterium]|nr:hypothetical protein [Desulfobacterales bacterium]